MPSAGLPAGGILCYTKNMKISRLLQEEELKPQIVISVRNLVEFLMNAGDIDDRHGGQMRMEAMQEGSRIHRKIQRRAGADYHAEIPLKFIVSYEEYDLAIEGRADGIIYEEGLLEETSRFLEDPRMDPEEGQEESKPSVMIHQIKGVYLHVEQMAEPNAVHLAQAKCYAFIFATQHALPAIGVQMTYCNLDTEEIRRFQMHYSYDEIEAWFLELVASYKKWSDFLFHHKMIRQQSIRGLEFPYAYRQGQKKLVTDVYRSIMREKTLFLQAPTGTGKTLATIFPAIQAMGQNMGDKIFYLTAKNATGVVAHDTFLLMEEQGYEGKTVVITAKDKMCLVEERSCNPDDCPYAKGHFDRVNDAVYDILQEENMMDRDCILRWAKDRRVCPFEYSLDIASWVDHIICDYNYVFDPNVCLKRFFAEGIRGDYLFLVDEAHNLVERARDMYSETLVKEDFLAMKKKLKIYGKKLENTLERCNKEMLVLKRQCEKLLVLEEMDSFLFALFLAAAAMDELLQKEGNIVDRDEVLDFYFKVRNFVNLSDDFDEHYRIYCDYDEKGQFCLHLFCVDPSYMLQKRLDRSRACVFFSATLLPIRYYKELLCCDDDVYAIYADSVFEQEKRALLIGRDVSSRYTRRTFAEYLAFADYIEAIVEKKKGNYMVFCPSYKMLEEISQKFMAKSLGSCDVICQRSGMSEQEREDFLKEFEEVRERSFVAFCVMGGVFSEGIDLTEEKLIGAIIVGVGLPQIGNEREVMKQYFEATGRDGFSFAYLYPGMNKVIQAAGRVIRTKSDEGVIALLDERFTKSEYRQTFPREWNDGKICDRHTVGDLVDDFWQKR